MIRDIYVEKIVYLQSAESLEQYQLVHATWTALIMWRKAGEILGLSIGSTPLDMRSIEHRDPPRFKLGIMYDTMRQRVFNILPALYHLFNPVTPSPVVTNKSLPFPPTPTRPAITIEKNDMNSC